MTKADRVTPRSQQLPLNLQLDRGCRFDNYVSGSNHDAVSAARARTVSMAPPLYLWGASGVGKTHLLESICEELRAASVAAFYVPLRDHAKLAPEMLHGLGDGSGVGLAERGGVSPVTVCLDDVEAIAGQSAWEEALFHLYNRADASRLTMVYTANIAPTAAPFALADLQSRLAATLVYHLDTLNDEHRIEALTVRAAQRGLELPVEAARYVLTRHERGMHSLFEFLDRLDRSALAAQRRITVPFVRTLLRDDDPDR